MLSTSAIDCISRVGLRFVASVTSGGRPSVSPKGTFVVLDERTIAFGEIRSPGTMSNIGHSPEVEVNFVDPFTRKGWRIRGLTSVLRRETDDFDEIFSKWTVLWGYLCHRIKAIVVVWISQVKPLSMPSYDDGVSEAEMVAVYKEKYAEMYL
jgi:uncharacterized protein